MTSKLLLHFTMTWNMLLLFHWRVTAPLSCGNPPAPDSNIYLTVSRDIVGTTATYTCPPGWHFAGGATRRTLVCRNGTWPQKAPLCTGKLSPPAPGGIVMTRICLLVRSLVMLVMISRKAKVRFFHEIWHRSSAFVTNVTVNFWKSRSKFKVKTALLKIFHLQ